MVWRGGVLPEGGPPFAEELTADLLDFGYSILALALELRDANREREVASQFATRDALDVAAQAIESAVRRGDPGDPSQGRHLVVCAATFHLAGYAARSFSLLPMPALDRNLASVERALALLLRRDLVALRLHIAQWLRDPENTDERISHRLADVDDPFEPQDAAFLALAAGYYRSLGLADTALLFGDTDVEGGAVKLLHQVVENAAEIGNIPMWWVATLTMHLLRDLWEHSLHQRLPPDGFDLPDRWAGLRRDFIAQLVTRRPPHIELWPSQIDAAARALDPTDDLVIALPTSAGKTRIAELCILRALADERRVVYVTPLRALSAQVERVLGKTFVPLDVGVTSLYGAAGTTTSDAESLATAEVVVATPEKLDFALRQDPNVIDDVGLVVFDEGHMIGLGSREIRYEVLIQRLLRRSDAERRRIVCLSAMFNAEDPHFKDFNEWLRSDAPGDAVQVKWRPTRQRFATLDWSDRSHSARLGLLEREEAFVPRFFEELPAQRKRRRPFPSSEIDFCIAAANAFARDGHNVLIYSPQRSQVEPLVREFCRVHAQGYLADIKPPTGEYLAAALAIGREWLGAEHPAVQGLEIGVGGHHAALPRPFLAAIERLLDARRLHVVVASPTLAQGIDLACSVLLFRSLTRFDAHAGKHVGISAAEFANVAGRAGRAYVDLDGLVVLPTYEAAGTRRSKHALFNELIAESKGQRLRSGLAQLVLELSAQISARLDVAGATFLEYVTNQRELWDRKELEADAADDDDETARRSLDEYLADLDVAILSLIDPLDSATDELAELLDGVLGGSLWSRTLAHATAAERKLATALLVSRAEWLWQRTDDAQRKACFFAGLGSRSGIFLYERLDVLVDLLVELHGAVLLDDEEAVGELVVKFADAVREDPFFFPKTPPVGWQAILSQWVSGTAFSEILDGRSVREAQRTQSFIQDGAVFKLVWAAESVRVQAIAAAHARAEELGDGPAFALTYGVSSIAAALLCQIGFASRVGAVWVTRKLNASFVDIDGMHEWLNENAAFLSAEEFWESPDHSLLWSQTSTPASQETPRKWKRERHEVEVRWTKDIPTAGSRVRLVPRLARAVAVCSIELAPLGTATLPFNPARAAVDAVVAEDGAITVEYFGR